MTTTRIRAGSRAVTPVASTPAVGTPAVVGPPPFDGYPYLVARIGRTALRHFSVLPAEWSRDRLVDLLCRQAEANQLETCLCLGPIDAVYVKPPGLPTPAPHIPTGIPVLDRLVVADPLPDSADLARRHAALVATRSATGRPGTWWGMVSRAARPPRTRTSPGCGAPGPMGCRRASGGAGPAGSCAASISRCEGSTTTSETRG